jgi:competence protein CoiA
VTALAISRDGKPVLAESFNEHDWQALKDSYKVGDLLMPCCMALAIPKTSPNFLQFFAHLSDECASSPESQWHLASKEALVRELLSLGVEAQLEKTGRSAISAWKADIFFVVEGRQIAIEVQHSYQHLRDYLDRQKRYVQSGVEAYWLLYSPRYMTLAKSLSKHRIKTEFAGKLPDGSLFPCIPQLPIAYFDPSDEHGMVKGAMLFRTTLKAWLKSLISNEFKYAAGAWRIG